MDNLDSQYTEIGNQQKDERHCDNNKAKVLLRQQSNIWPRQNLLKNKWLSERHWKKSL